MFKSSHTISFKGASLTSHNAVYVAPRFDIFGLPFQSGTTPLKPVEKFLAMHGLILEEIIENGDRFLRLSGSFQLNKKSIEDLARIEPNCQESNNSRAEYSHQHSQLIMQRLNDSSKLTYNYRRQDADAIHPAQHISDLKTIVVEPTHSIVVSGCRIHSDKSIQINSQRLFCSVTLCDETNLGSLNEFFAMRDIELLTDNICIKDSVFLAAQSIRIGKLQSHINLGLTPDRNWVNLPPITSLTPMYALLKTHKLPQGLSTSSPTELKDDRNYDSTSLIKAQAHY